MSIQALSSVDTEAFSENGRSRRFGDMSRKPYEPPTVVHTEKLGTRANVCAKDTVACNPNPIQS
jgi:hypothetical protein